MRYLLPLLAVILLAGVGCVENQPAPSIPSMAATDGVTSAIDNNPPPIVLPLDKAVAHDLLLYDILIRDITVSSAVLEFKSNINCTANIVLIEGEMPRSYYKSENRANVHYIAMTGLKGNTSYTVVIEATGSASYKTTREFTTRTPIPIFDYTTPSFFYGWGGYSTPVSTVTASLYSCDGTFAGTIWSVSGYPTESKELELTINNGLNTAINVIFTYYCDECPADGDGKVVLNAESLYIGAKTSEIITITADILADAPIGGYKFVISLAY